MRRATSLCTSAALLVLLSGCQRENDALESCVDAKLAEQGAVFTGARNSERQIERDAQREQCRIQLEKGAS